MIIYITLGIIYYILSSLLFLKLLENECLISLSNLDVIMGLIPVIRFIYYIYLKFIQEVKNEIRSWNVCKI